jgi:hypothetical protein
MKRKDELKKHKDELKLFPICAFHAAVLAWPSAG